MSLNPCPTQDLGKLHSSSHQDSGDSLGESAAQERIVRVLDLYDLGEFRGCRRIRRGHVNESWLVETSSGRYFFKRRHPGLGSPQQIESQHALVDHLRNVGFPAPAVVRTRESAAYVDFQGQIYQIQGYIPGEHGDATRPAHFSAATSTLAWYHRVVEGFDHPGLHLPRERYGSVALRRITRRLREAWGDLMPSDVDALLGQVEEQARDLERSSEAFCSLPELVIHGDYYTGNLIFQGDSVVGVVDYDKAQWCSRTMEVAEALIFFATERLPRFRRIVYRGFLDLDAVARFLRVYIAGLNLWEPEIRALPYFVLAIWLCASLDPPLGPRLSLDAAPYILPEVMALAEWVKANGEKIVDMGLAARAAQAA